MIPKIIHYCWFGGKPLPPLALSCINSWKKFFPDYEIKEWNEKNFDVNQIKYTKEAYKQKKYAYVSDYARFKILKEYGGIYFDTDVEIIRSFKDIIDNGNFFGFEVDPDGKNTPGIYAPKYCFAVNPGLGFGFEKNHPFLNDIIKKYSTLSFDGGEMNPWLKTIVAYTTELLCKYGLENRKGIQTISFKKEESLFYSYITIYPSDYFAPTNVITGKTHITKNTRSIHRYMGSWNTSENKNVYTKIKCLLKNLIPEYLIIIYNKIQRRKYKIEYRPSK